MIRCGALVLVALSYVLSAASEQALAQQPTPAAPDMRTPLVRLAGDDAPDGSFGALFQYGGQPSGELPPEFVPQGRDENAAADGGPVDPPLPDLYRQASTEQAPVGSASLSQPAAPWTADAQRQWYEDLSRRILDLETDRQNRRLIERLREQEATRQGIDTTGRGWVNKWGGRIMGDWVNWAHQSQFQDPVGNPVGEAFGNQQDYFEFRRLRLFASGEGYGVYEYQLELEFAPEVDLQAPVVDNEVDLGNFGTELKDAYVGIRDIPLLGYVRVGHFKVPFGLSRLTNSKYITFMERPLSDVFAPRREVGVTVYNHLADQSVTWAWGAFFHDMDEMAHSIVENNQGIRLSGRLTWTPFYDELSEGRYLFHAGLGYVYTQPRQSRFTDDAGNTSMRRMVRFRSRPEIHRGNRLISTDRLVSQQYHMVDAELAWVHGPLSLQSELVWTGIDQSELGHTDLYGAYVHASYFLTGENRAYNRLKGTFGRVVPYENFWIVNTPGGRSAGWGAWEITARWSYLDFPDVDGFASGQREIIGQQLHDITVGLNWYWNPHTRLMLNWIHPFQHVPRIGAPVPVDTQRVNEGDIIGMRLQLDF